MNKSALFFVFMFSFLSLYTVSAYAHCPLCSAATGALVATARVAGVDDAVVGTFIGAFTISTAFWFSRFLSGRLNRHLARSAGATSVKLNAFSSLRRVMLRIALQPYVLSIAFLLMTVASFYWTGLLGVMPDFLWVLGMERLLFGLVLGSVVSAGAFEAHKLLRRLNGGANYFPMQGIALPLAVLLAADAALYVAGVV